MTREKLSSLPLSVLQKLAVRLHIQRWASLERKELERLLFDAIAEDQQERADNSPQFWSELSKYDLVHDQIDLVDDAALRLDFCYELSYLTALQYAPQWLYIFWDVSHSFLEKYGLSMNSPVLLRIGRAELDMKTPHDVRYSRHIRVKLNERKHYVNLPWLQCPLCWAELCLARPQTKVLLRSAHFSAHSPALSLRTLSSKQINLLRLSALNAQENFFYDVHQEDQYHQTEST